MFVGDRNKTTVRVPAGEVFAACKATAISSSASARSFAFFSGVAKLRGSGFPALYRFGSPSRCEMWLDTLPESYSGHRTRYAKVSLARYSLFQFFPNQPRSAGLAAGLVVGVPFCRVDEPERLVWVKVEIVGRRWLGALPCLQRSDSPPDFLVTRSPRGRRGRQCGNRRCRCGFAAREPLGFVSSPSGLCSHKIVDCTLRNL